MQLPPTDHVIHRLLMWRHDPAFVLRTAQRMDQPADLAVRLPQDLTANDREVLDYIRHLQTPDHTSPLETRLYDEAARTAVDEPTPQNIARFRELYERQQEGPP